MTSSISNNSNAQLTQLANEFINQTFWGPMLREFRSAQRPSVFGEGPGSKMFVQQLDAELLKRMSQQQGSTTLSAALLRQLGADRVGVAALRDQVKAGSGSVTEQVIAEAVKVGGQTNGGIKSMRGENHIIRGSSDA